LAIIRDRDIENLGSAATGTLYGDLPAQDLGLHAGRVGTAGSLFQRPRSNRLDSNFDPETLLLLCRAFERSGRDIAGNYGHMTVEDRRTRLATDHPSDREHCRREANRERWPLFKH